MKRRTEITIVTEDFNFDAPVGASLNELWPALIAEVTKFLTEARLEHSMWSTQGEEDFCKPNLIRLLAFKRRGKIGMRVG